MLLKTKINGFYCFVKVIHYSPAVAMNPGKTMEDAEEAIPVEFEYEIYESLDESMKRWIDLENAVTDEEEIRLIEEYEASVLADKYGKDF